MDENQTLIDRMVLSIANQAFQLEHSCLHLFLEWLSCHSSKVQTNEQIQLDDSGREQFKIKLNAWFQSLSMNGLLWEYRLILDEIAWCRNLNPTSFVLQENR